MQSDQQSPPVPDLSFLAEGGALGALIRAHPWAHSPLGPPQDWQPALKATVRIALTTQHPIFIFWGAQGICLYNDAYSASVGPEKHPAMLGAPAQAAWPEIWHIIGPQIDHVMRGAGATWHENQLVPILRKGRLEDVYWTYSYGPIHDESAPHRVGGVLVICSETTEQVLAAQRLAAEKQTFADLFEQAPSFMALLRGPEHVIEFANPRYRQLVGARSIIGLTVAQALPEAAEQGFLQLLDGAYRSGEAHSAYGIRYAPPGRSGGPEEHFLDFVYQPIKDAQGSVTGIFVEGVDVSQRRVIERALAESEERFRLAVQSASLGTFDVVLDSGMITLSPVAQTMFGVSQGEVALGDGLARVHPDDRAAVEAAIAAARASADGGYRQQHRILLPDGTLRWVNAAGKVTRPDGDGSGGERLSGVLWDTTELQQLLQTLRAADRQKDEFLATLAHELRNPLAPIRTAAQLLANPQLPAERVAWCSAVIQRQTRTMALLLDDLLDISRITTGMLQLKKRHVPVQSVIDAAVETARPLLDAKRHQLQVSNAAGQTLVEADPLRLAQVLVNLLTNAAKYTDPDGDIRLEASAEGGTLQFTVTDTGIGLQPQLLPTVFTMFNQIKGALDRSEGGLGIGLAFTKGLVELHGGSVVASSGGLGMGSSFRVRLPLGAAPPAPDAAAEALPSGQQGAQPERPRHRVLVADDNVDAAAALSMVLEMEGYDVVTAHDGLRAWNLASAAPPDAALLDIGMPALDGYQLAARIRTSPWGRALLLVALTGWGQDEDSRRALDAGFDQHLTKPADPAAILQLLAARFNAQQRG